MEMLISFSSRTLAPAHTAKTTSKCFADHDITVLDWPANMPDLNPIWNLWDIFKRKMRNSQSNTQKMILQHCSVYLKKYFSFNTIMLGFPFIQLHCVKLTWNSWVLAQLNIFIWKNIKDFTCVTRQWIFPFPSCFAQGWIRRVNLEIKCYFSHFLFRW